MTRQILVQKAKTALRRLETKVKLLLVMRKVNKLISRQQTRPPSAILSPADSEKRTQPPRPKPPLLTPPLPPLPRTGKVVSLESRRRPIR